MPQTIMRPSRRVSFFTLPEVSEFTVDVEVGRSITVYRNGQYCQQFFVGEVVTQYVSRIPNFDHKYTAQIVNITAKTVKFHHGVVGHYEFCQMNWNLDRGSVKSRYADELLVDNDAASC